MQTHVYGNPRLAPYSVNAGFCRMLARYVEARGIHHPQLESFILNYQNKDRIPLTQWWKALDTTAECVPDQAALGLEIGCFIEPAYMGVMGYLSASAETFGEALTNFERFQRLVYEGNPGERFIDGSTLVLRWKTDLGIANRLVNDTALAVLVTFFRKAMQQPELSPALVKSIYPRPENVTAYEHFFKCPVAFSAESTEVHFPIEYLQLPIPTTDQGLHSLLQHQAQEMLSSLPPGDEWELRLRDVIVRSLHQGNPTVEYAAQQFHLSPRTLHRRLSDRGLSYNEILLEIRKQLARQYLADFQLSLASISLLLGYSEQSAFTRAFKQWFGEAPKKYRDKLLPSR